MQSKKIRTFSYNEYRCSNQTIGSMTVICFYARIMVNNIIDIRGGYYMLMPFVHSRLFTENEFYTSQQIYNFIFKCINNLPTEDKNQGIKLNVEIFDRFNENEDNLDEEMLIFLGVETKEENIEETDPIYRFNYRTIIKRLNIEDYLLKREEYLDEDIEFKECILRKKIAKFVNKKYAFKHFDEKVKERILGQPNISEITYNVFMWLRSLADGNAIKYNAMIVAPSGCGKTETYRVIKEILKEEIADIPVSQVDITQLTSEGFSGKNTNDLFTELINKSINGIGIVVLDEIDKRLIPSYSSRGCDVNAEIQSQILTFIEGCEYNDKDTDITINTSNTLFVASGAFQYIRDKKNNHKENRTIGFFEKQQEEEQHINSDITIADIMENGALCELMGRFSTIINLHKLDRKAVATICRRYADEMEEQVKCKILLTEDAIDQLFFIYDTNNLGCRILKSTMWNRISEVCIQMERNENISKRKNYEIIYCTGKVSFRHRKQDRITCMNIAS